MDNLVVNLGARSYTILFGNGVLSGLGSACRELRLGKTAAVVTNPTIGEFYGKQVLESLAEAGFQVHLVEIPDGESYKTSATLNSIYDAFIEHGLNRGSFVVALGGGVVGDITGFAAATFLRGIPFVQVPTTLLAQVDSSVGGKTGINLISGKNLIGAFYQPRLVLVDTSTLDSLPEREYASGLAEVIKYGVVCDAGFFGFIYEARSALKDREKSALQKAIRTSCLIKSSIVERDELEGGYRAVLNYGHTFAHAVERLTNYSGYLHGEAVSVGMAQAAKLSEMKGYAEPSDTKKILDILSYFDLPVILPRFSAEEYREAMLKDKKVRDGGINFVFNRRIGDSVIENVSDWDYLLQNLRSEV